MAIAGSVALGGPGTSDELGRSIVEHASAIRLEARVGVPGKPAQIALAPAGLALVHAHRTEAYRWSEVRSVGLRRRAILVRTQAARERLVSRKGASEVRSYVEKRTRALRVVIDGVEEPRLTPGIVQVLEEMRRGKFSYQGTSWIAHKNALDRLHGAFDEQDDAVLPAAAAVLWLAVGLIMTLVVPVAVNVAAARAVPAGAFAIADPVGALDPRSAVAGFALSAMIATLVLRLALGPSSTVWARGAARGWGKAASGRLARLGVRQMGRILLGTSSAAVMALLALLSFWPNLAATVLVDQAGVRNEVLLPFISLEEPWRSALEITRAPEGVTITFADGRRATTTGHVLQGGTLNQFFELTNTWWHAPR